jgi:hypothetical protein
LLQYFGRHGLCQPAVLQSYDQPRRLDKA